VDYPLPNTGLKYKDSDPKGDELWERQHGKSSNPEEVVTQGEQPAKAASPPDGKAGSGSGCLSKGSAKAPVQSAKSAPKVIGHSAQSFPDLVYPAMSTGVCVTLYDFV
jgi:hypothetical protein